MSQPEGNQSHAFIRDIVAQVKSGKKDKAAAFSELKSLLQSSSRPATTTPSSTQDVKEPASTTSYGESGTLSSDDKQSIINRIMEKKKKAMEAAGALTSSEESISPSPALSPTQSPARSPAEKLRPSSPIRGAAEPAPESVADEWQAPYASREQFYADGINKSAPVDESMDARALRVSQTEAAIRQEMFGECTFRPKIKPLPASYGAKPAEAEAPFYDRVTKWQREKEIEASRRKEVVDNSLVLDCTFQPRINKNSERAIKTIRGNNYEDPAERLYRSNEASHIQRSKFIEDELLREEQEDAQACTFKPQLSTKKYSFVKAKFDKDPKKDQMYSEIQTDMMKECTFTPKVNGVRSGMPSAKMYVNIPVVDRLSRPFSAPGPEGDNMGNFDANYNSDTPVLDVASFMGMQSGPSFKTPGKDGGASVGNDSNATSKLSPQAREARQKSFKEFLGRQMHVVHRKSAHVKEIRESITPSFAPNLCRKSLEMTERSFGGEFLSRLDRDVSRRSDSEVRASTLNHSECTFKPTLAAKKDFGLKSRSAYEMSRGDLLRKETTHRMMKLKTEQDLLSHATFKPQISKRAQSAGRSRLQLSTDPEAFIAKHHESIMKRVEESKESQNRRAEKELEGCTFAPQTKECPEYVKRIAKSMTIVRAARNSEVTELTPPKPDWR
jgi:hypothetical protein